jgi:hypothetical protein
MNRMRVGLAWLLVSVPLAWGVARSVQKSLPLFGIHPPTPQAVPSSNPIPTPIPNPNPGGSR